MTQDEIQRRARQVTQSTRQTPAHALPGRRQALPEGALPVTHQQVQGDENRDPSTPPAPPPMLEARETVADHLRRKPPK